MKRNFFIIAGTAALGVGILGVFIPILPTTPFLLLAAVCYMRGSKRLYGALLGNRFVGAYIRNYLEGRGMSPRVKIGTLGLLWTGIACAALFATNSLGVRIVLAAALLGVTVHILLLKSVKTSAHPENSLK